MTGNGFLDMLSPEDTERLAPYLRRVFLAAGSLLVEQGFDVETVHFPIDAQITNILTQGDGSAIEVSVVGAEGVTGLLPFIAHAASAWRTVVRLPGDAWMISASTLRLLADQSATLRHALISLGYYYQVQGVYNGACAATHPISARVARWVLTAADLAGAREIRFTQEEMASLLAVQRTSVVEAFGSLKSAGSIRHLRGKILILDRGSLTRQSCSCYGALKQQAVELGVLPKSLVVG
ncbi:Crp/Fnr family transcriptional regulator [Brevundimonas sp. VNH65]|uniref:Crp/Fnr family transcriptional regulator n=1 Tax=Brevundimonas sp. VNH65 TaxID=3400917 RepID=UPI003C041FA9